MWLTCKTATKLDVPQNPTLISFNLLFFFKIHTLRPARMSRHLESSRYGIHPKWILKIIQSQIPSPDTGKTCGSRGLLDNATWWGEILEAKSRLMDWHWDALLHFTLGNVVGSPALGVLQPSVDFYLERGFFQQQLVALMHKWAGRWAGFGQEVKLNDYNSLFWRQYKR